MSFKSVMVGVFHAISHRAVIHHHPSTPSGDDTELFRHLASDMQAFRERTPEQRKVHSRELNQSILRTSLTRSGFKDEQLQDDIVAFVDEQEASREAVRRAGAQVELGMEPLGLPTEAQEIEALLNSYLSAVEEAKAWRGEATKAFESKISLDNKPHLRAFLVINGIIGDAACLTGDVILTGSMGSTGIYKYIPIGETPAEHQ